MISLSFYLKKESIMPTLEKYQTKRVSLILMFLYILASVCAILMYTLDNDYLMLTSSVMFILTILINRLSYPVNPYREIIVKILYLTELCFISYIALLFIYGNEYFMQYKLLLLPSLILSIYLSFSRNK